MVFRRTRSPYLPQRPFRHHSTMQNPAIVVKNHRFLLPIRSVATEKVVSYLSHTLRSRVVTQNEARPGVTWNLRIVICEFHVVPGLFCFRATSGNRSLTLHAAEGPRGRRGPSTAKGQGNDDDGITRIEADGIRGTGDRRNRCSGHRNRNHRNRRGRGGGRGHKRGSKRNRGPRSRRITRLLHALPAQQRIHLHLRRARRHAVRVSTPALSPAPPRLSNQTSA